MKKLWFFRSSATSNGNDNALPQALTDKQAFVDQASDGSHFQSSKHKKSQRQTNDINGPSKGPGLRRSRSLSSAASIGEGRHLDSTSRQQNGHSRFRTSTPERQYKATHCEMPNFQCASGLDRPGSAASSRTHHDFSGNSSTSSSNVSSKVLDRYIDGEQQQERSRHKNSSSQRNCPGNGNGWRPPRVQCLAPTSPTNSVKDKPRSHSFREAKSFHSRFLSGEWAENGLGHESPRSLAKNVIERLSQTYVYPKTSSKEIDHDIPITIGDIYGRSSKKCFDSDNIAVVNQTRYSTDNPYETVNGYHPEDYSGFQKQTLGEDFYEVLDPFENQEDVDEELRRRTKEAEERVMLLSEELERGSFLRGSGFDVSSLIPIIRNLTEDKISLALEILGILQSRVSERASAKEELRLAKAELEFQTRKLEKEKSELQSGLEKELDRRSGDWFCKLEKYQLEEQRLRERVRELAEQNVSLQREVCSFSEREMESRSMMSCSEAKLKDLTTAVDEMRGENHDLQKNLSELQDKFRAAKEDRDCIKRNFKEKEKECKELHKSITRLLRTCSEQEKTIDGLRERFSDELGKNPPVERFEKHVAKLQMEQMRLTGVELALRRELESYRVEVDSLRHENVNILNRLKDNGKDSGALTVKLDKEIWGRIYCLQHQGLSLLNESSQLCSKLLEFIKEKARYCPETKLRMEVSNNGLDGQFVIESETKIQGLKHGSESLSRSLQMLSTLLHEKNTAAESEVHFQDADGSAQLGDQNSEDLMRSELKAETLLTSLLREKLYSKEVEVEMLQAELATAVRGNDILRCEVQNTMDNLSCVTHKLKDVELQMLKKDDNIERLQNELQESKKELAIVRGILPNISGERDMMWAEVKQYREENMLLNSEVNLLKTKIEALDEDILLKEGQISILKDTLGSSKPFDLLASPDSAREFLLQ